VQQVHIEIVRLEALQAALARRDRAAARGVLGQHLADEINLLATACDDVGDELFGAAVAVHLGRVDQYGTQIDAGVQRQELLGALAPVIADLPRALTQP
jgi:hypothetical protein